MIIKNAYITASCYLTCPVLLCHALADVHIVARSADCKKLSLQSQAAQQARSLDQDALQRLTELLCCKNQSVAEVAARIIARCCHDRATVNIHLAQAL